MITAGWNQIRAKCELDPCADDCACNQLQAVLGLLCCNAGYLLLTLLYCRQEAT